MALTDINFQQAEHQNFILEIDAGVLNAPIDILFESSGSQIMIMEVAPASSGGNIFIMSE